MIKKTIGLIILPLYTIVAIIGLMLWCLVLLINQENNAIGHAINKFCQLIEIMFYKLYGVEDERDN